MINSSRAVDGSTIRPILLQGSNSPAFACGFYCDGACHTYLFAIFIVSISIFDKITDFGLPKVVWTANRDNPVEIDSTLEFMSDGNLVLRDADGTTAWSTNTANKSVAGLNFTETGNLVLFDTNNASVWQSFDHPTDTLLLGQKLVEGQQLTSSTSSTNWTQGLYSLRVSRDGLFARIESNPPQVYYQLRPTDTFELKGKNYVEFLNGSFAWNGIDWLLYIPAAPSMQYIKLEADGHLKVFKSNEMEQGVDKDVDDLLTIADSEYPMVSGEYGISFNKQCSCPTSTDRTNFFKELLKGSPISGVPQLLP